MNFRNQFSAVLMLSAMLFATTACDDSMPVQVKDSPVKEVAKTVNQFYDTLEEEENYAAMEAHQKEFRSMLPKDRQNFMAEAPGMEYLDTSTPEATEKSYLILTENIDVFESVRGRYSENPESLNTIDMAVPQEAITVNGEDATVDMNLAAISLNGKGISDGATKNPTLILKKLETGKWVITDEVDGRNG